MSGPARTLLVIDDDGDIRRSIADALEDEGWRVVGAAGGHEALALLVEGQLRPDVILLDMMMPEMDGWAFRAEQQRRPEIAAIPIIVFTAYGVPPDTVTRLQARGVLRKPLRLEQLLSALARI